VLASLQIFQKCTVKKKKWGNRPLFLTIVVFILHSSSKILIAYTNLLSGEDVASRIKKANGVFVQLYPVWRNLNISKEVKLRIFNTNAKSVLLYACETWKTTNQITRRL